MSAAAPTTHMIAAVGYRVRRFGVRVVAGPDTGAAVVADTPEITVGSAPGNDLRLSDDTASRHHCCLTSTPEGLRLRDLGSTNGTLIAGCRVETAYLAPGTRITAGRTELIVDAADGEIHEPLSADGQFGPLLGVSAAMRRLFATLPRLAGSEATLLIEGETGTGKSALARAIHEHSHRAGGPFVVVDCGAIPATVIESELFGHERGAFTGAHAAKLGLFEAANGGTIFLDEIGELPHALQPKLLRVLEERVVRHVGGHRDVAVDVRMIAATHRDLRHEVNRGAFRSDLFFRLHTVRIVVPPLRERREDIRVLATHFWRESGGRDAGAPPRDLLARLCRGAWPGNVRELRAAVERTLLLGDPGLELAPTPATSDGAARAEDGDELVPFRDAKAEAVAAWERAYLSRLIRRHEGNISQAARAARMNRNHLRDLLLRHRVEVR